MRKLRARAGLLAAALLLVSCGSDNGTAPDTTGGGGGGGTYEPPDITRSEVTGDLNVGRNLHTATLLRDGRVLVIGGFDGAAKLSSCEIFNPKTRTWQLTRSMTDARALHTSTLLADGRVFVTGGSDDSQRSIVWYEVFDPSAGKWTPVVKTGAGTTSMDRSRSSHTATLLPDGTVLIAGGWHSGSTDYLKLFEIYDPVTHTCAMPITVDPYMHRKRNGHTATALTDGRVLVAGGFNTEDKYLTHCEIYDPATGTWAEVEPMNVARSLHTACILSDGRVFVAGGSDAVSGYTPTSEVYDPVANTWTAAGGFRELRSRHSMTPLGQNRVLAAGNLYSKSVEMYTFAGATGDWAMHANMFEYRQHFTMTAFSNDVVLIAGGINNEPGNNRYLTGCELYLP